MKKLLSWRMEQVFQGSAWKKLSFTEWVAYVCGTAAFVVSYVSFAELRPFCLVAIFIITMALLLEVGAADDYRKVIIGGKKYKMYVYKTGLLSPAYQIALKSRSDMIFLEADGYENELFAPEEKQFIYRPANQNEWFLYDGTSQYHRYLGIRVSETVFISDSEEENKTVLRILNGSRFIAKTVDCFTFEVFVPAEGKAIADKDVRYLVTSVAGEYSVYALTSVPGENPVLEELQPAVIMCRQDKINVSVLILRDGKYKIYYQTESFIPCINGHIVEIDTGVPMHGRILRLNPETMTLEKLLEGHISSIGFQDGSVICENQKFYL